MTKTCCLDCATKPCPEGYNCRDFEMCCSWCDRQGGEIHCCLGDCDNFTAVETPKFPLETRKQATAEIA